MTPQDPRASARGSCRLRLPFGPGECLDEGDKNTPDCAVDETGAASAVWSQADADFENIYIAEYELELGLGSVWSNRRDPDTNWTPTNAERVENIPTAASLPRIAVDEARHAHAVCLHSTQTGAKMRTKRFE